jgi:hypothetical protein
MPRLLGLSLSCLALTLVAYGSGCGGSKPGLGGNGGGGSSGGGGDDGGGGTSTPHALGIVALGESHAPSSGTSTPSVLAAFIPDAAAVAQTCAKQISGCSFVSAPHCGGSGSSCGQGETCTWDSACNPTCTAQCSLTCGMGQECYFASPNQPECRQIQTFDAGALAFAGAGMTIPITLFPPYAYQSTAQDAPFLAGKPIEVQASGAAGAGFDKFDEQFTATTLLQTNLTSISSAVSGTGAIPLTWAAGGDSINISVAGAGGVATCTATDSSGSFPIPRAVVTAALGNTTELSLTVTRERDEWHKSETTHGSLSTATVQPVGWLELTTTSSESASFQVNVVPQCTGAGEVMCPDGCFDTQIDQYHCGSCTTVCSSTETCISGQCTGTTSTTCTTCQNTADTGTCSASFTTCESDTECNSYGSCYAACAAGDPTCESNCEALYPNGYTDFLSYKDCICFTACPSECATACAQ